MDNWEVGRAGEYAIRDLFIKNKISFMQADMLARINGKWAIIEVKHQDKYSPPPFWGHPKPKWQIEARLKLQSETGIIAILFILDKETDVIYWQYMSKLIEGKQYQTRGDKPRLIFPLESYNILDTESLPEEWSAL